MSKGGSFLGAIVKSVVIGVVASYAIKYIQDKISEHREDASEQETAEAE